MVWARTSANRSATSTNTRNDALRRDVNFDSEITLCLQAGLMCRAFLCAGRQGFGAGGDAALSGIRPMPWAPAVLRRRRITLSRVLLSKGRNSAPRTDEPNASRSAQEDLASSQDRAKRGIGWEAGIRTPITASRAPCPTVERPPSDRPQISAGQEPPIVSGACCERQAGAIML